MCLFPTLLMVTGGRLVSAGALLIAYIYIYIYIQVYVSMSLHASADPGHLVLSLRP